MIWLTLHLRPSSHFKSQGVKLCFQLAPCFLMFTSKHPPCLLWNKLWFQLQNEILHKIPLPLQKKINPYRQYKPNSVTIRVIMRLMTCLGKWQTCIQFLLNIVLFLSVTFSTFFIFYLNMLNILWFISADLMSYPQNMFCCRTLHWKLFIFLL